MIKESELEEIEYDALKHRFVYEVINERFRSEGERSNTLDEKASGIISFVGIIIGLQAGLGSFLLKEAQINKEYYLYLSTIFFLGILSLTCSILLGLSAYRSQTWKVVPDTGEELIEKYAKNADISAIYIMQMLSTEKSKATIFNRFVNDNKVRFINYGFAFLVGGIVINVLFILGLLITG